MVTLIMLRTKIIRRQYKLYILNSIFILGIFYENNMPFCKDSSNICFCIFQDYITNNCSWIQFECTCPSNSTGGRGYVMHMHN